MTQHSTELCGLTFYEVCVCAHVYSLGVSSRCVDYKDVRVCVCILHICLWVRAVDEQEEGDTQRKSKSILNVFVSWLLQLEFCLFCSLLYAGQDVMAKWQSEETV